MSEGMGTLGLAMVGCGGISGAHLRGVANTPGARLVATMDVVEDRARAAADEYAVTPYTSLETALADDRVDAVILALPHHLHLPATESAAQAGKHILVEKPMALDLAEAQRMVAAAEQAGVRLMVGQSTRFQPEVWQAKALIAQGRIGQVRQCICQRAALTERLSTPWRYAQAECGGLYLPIFGSHDVDMIWWLMDAMPQRVQAVLRSFSPLVESESDGALLIEFQGEAIASVAFSLNSHMRRQTALFIGSEGTLAIENRELILNGQAVEVNGSVDAFTRQTIEFVSAIREGRQPVPSGRDALRTMSVLDAAKASARQGCAVDIESAAIS